LGTYWNFHDYDVITVTLVQYFAQQFSFATRKCGTALWVKREKWTSPTSKRV